MIQGRKMVPPSLEEGKNLGHYGVPGMKWGQRKAGSSSSSSSAPKSRRSLSKQQKEIAIVTVGTGASIAAALLAGPTGAMAVSALTRVAQIKNTTTDRSTPGSELDSSSVREENNFRNNR